MSDRVHISEVEALDRMGDALRSFRSRVADEVNRVARVADRILDLLGDTILELERRIRALEKEKQRWWAEMNRCHARQRNASWVDCRSIEQAYFETVAALERAEILLREARVHFDLVDRQRDEFKRTKVHYENALDEAERGGGERLSSTARRARAVHRLAFSPAGRSLNPRPPLVGERADTDGATAKESTEGRWRWAP